MRSAEGYRVVGFTGRGPRPVGWFDLPVEAGVHALYGRNGAGKTTVLNRVRQALTGSDQGGPPSTCGYCIQLIDPDSPLGDVLLESVKDYLPARIGHWSGDPQTMLEALWQRMDHDSALDLDSVLTELLSAELLQEASPSPAGLSLCSQMVGQRLFWIAPGGPRGGGWSVWVAATRGLAEVSAVWDLCRLGWPTPNDERAIKRSLALTRLAARPTVPLLEAVDEALTELLGTAIDMDEVRLRLRDLSNEQLLDMLAGTIEDIPWPEGVTEPIRTSIGDWMSGTSPARLEDFPIPICKVAELPRPAAWVLPRLFEPQPKNAFVAETIGVLRYAASNKRLLVAVADEEVVFDPLAASKLTELVHLANEIFRSLLLDAPRLGCGLLEPEQWATSDAVNWHAFDRGSDKRIPITALSEAQRRWASFSIAGAIALNGEVEDDSTTVLVLDEPEQALHATAVRHLVRGLRILAGRTGMPIVVATHAAAFLDDAGVILHHVSRNSLGKTEVSRLTAPAREAAATLGLNAADMLQLYRVFLVVEGEHDKVVLETLIGDDLDNFRATVIPMRGVKSLRSIPDTRLIMDYTDAVILVVVDRVRAALLDSLGAARHEFVSSGKRSAIDVLETHLKRRDLTSEEELVCHLFRRGIDTNMLHRINVVGLSVPDIIELLPVEAFVKGASDWQELVAEWRASRDSGSLKFKDWLRLEKDARISTVAIGKVAASLDYVPDDIARIREMVSQLSFVAAAELPATL